MTWYGRNTPPGLGPDTYDDIHCETCDRRFSIVTEGDTGLSEVEGDAPNDDVTRCNQCPYSHHMCGYCERDSRERTCPEPWDCDECDSRPVRQEYVIGLLGFCGEQCLAIHRESELEREAS